MRNRVSILFALCSAILLGCCLASMPVAAEEVADAANVSLKSMSQAEYEVYREQLQQQVKEAAAPGQSKAITETESAQAKSEDSGYGRGYRSRTERGGRTGGGYRGGAMSRGGGRGR